MEQKIPMKTIYLLMVIATGLIGLAVGSTYAVFTATASIENPISISSNLSSVSEVIETVDVTVNAESSKTITLNVDNSSSSTLNYAVWYISDSLDISASIDSSSVNGASGSIGSNTSIQIIITINNSGTSSSNVQVGVSSSTEQIALSSDMHIVS